LTDGQVAALTELGLVWDPRADDFAQGLAALRAFVAEHRDARVPKDHRTQDGFPLGGWVDTRRQDLKRGRLSSQQVDALDELGFVWDPRAELFARGLAALRAFVDCHHHAQVPYAYVDGDGFALGLWVSNKRLRRRKSGLPTDQVAALDALGFSWS
jgi:hypothetical protein